MGSSLPVGSSVWPAFPLCGLGASKHISFSFVSVLFLVRARDSRQWERPSLLDMQDRQPLHNHADAAASELSRLPGRQLNVLRRSRWHQNKTFAPLKELPVHPPYSLSRTTFFLPELACNTTSFVRHQKT